MLLSSPAAKPLAIDDILPLLNGIASQRQEHFLVLTFDSINNLISRRLVFLGTVSSTIVHPREVFAVAVSDLATSIIICHNHPSGDVRPSADDKRTTKHLVRAGEILGVSVIDHLIVSRGKYYSFAEHGLIKATSVEDSN